MRTPHWTAEVLTIGELAERSGVSTSALRFYERNGLIYSRRTSGNQRRYPRDMLRRVAFIRATQSLGIPLEAIHSALSILPNDRKPNSEDWARVSAHWKKDLDARINHLQQLRDELSNCIGCGCLSLDRCASSNPKDVHGQQGQGAILLGKEDE